MVIVQPHPKLGARQTIYHSSLHLDFILTFLGQKALLSSMLLSVPLSRFSLPLSPSGPANGTLALNPSLLAGRDIPPLSSDLTQDSLLHDRLAEALQQALLGFAIAQSY
jgi:hypothetical protein